MVSVVIVHYKVEKELLACIYSIVRLESKVSYEIIVVDNDIENAFEKTLRKKFPKVRYVKAPGNIGYGAGNNLGASLSKGDFLFFLNPDTTIEENAISKLCKFLARDRVAGIVAPLLMNNGKPYPSQGSKKLGVLEGIVVLSFLNKLFPNNPISEKYFLRKWDKKNVHEVDVVPGTAFMIKRSIFNKIGGFDQRFFLFFEEFDLCKRVKKLGWKIFILPRAKVGHIWGASMEKSSLNIKSIFKKSRFYYFKKHYGIIPAILVHLVASFGRLQFLFLLFSIVILPLLIYMHTRGLVYSDEGYILNSAQRVLDGQIPYRDFHFVYTPGAIYVTVLSFILFGQSILAERVMSIALSLSTLFIIFLLLKSITKKYTLIFSGLLAYAVWGPMHINFLLPVMLAIFTGIFNCYFLLIGIDKKKSIFYFFAGVTTVITFLFKQNFGIGILLSSLFFFYLLEQKRTKKLSLYICGIIVASIVFIAYLVATHSLFAFVDDFKVYTLQRIVIDKTLDTPFIYSHGLINTVSKTILYTLPFLASLVAGLYALKYKKKYFFLAIFSCVYYVLGIRPTTDYVHLVPLLAVAGIPLVLISELSQTTLVKKISVIILAMFILLGLYTAFFKGYYRWEEPLIRQNYFSNNSRVRIWISKPDLMETEELLNYLGNKIKKGDYIFINNYNPMLYFMSGYRNPTKFDLLSFSKTDLPHKDEIIKDLKTKGVEIILTYSSSSGMYLGDYIIKNYKMTKKVNDLIIWERKI